MCFACADTILKILLCLDNKECYEYNTLNEVDRGISYGRNVTYCDRSGRADISPMWKGASWYRYYKKF